MCVCLCGCVDDVPLQETEIVQAKNSELAQAQLKLRDKVSVFSFVCAMRHFIHFHKKYVSSRTSLPSPPPKYLTEIVSEY